MLLKLVECLARLALPGTGPPSAEPGFGELLLDQADSAVVRPLGPDCGVGSLICLSRSLLGRGDGPAVFLRCGRVGPAVFLLRGRDGLAMLLLSGHDGLLAALLPGVYPGCCPCGLPWRARSRGSGASHRRGR